MNVALNSRTDSFLVSMFNTVAFHEADKLPIKIYPNPSSDIQTLVLTSERSSSLKITMYDVSGRVVRDVYNGKSIPGEKFYQVNLSTLASGVYIYKIQAGNEVLNAKIIKQ